MSQYNEENVFFKILQNKIPHKQIHETKHSLAFYDAFPRADIHALVIPKGSYSDFTDFQKKATTEEVLDLWSCVHETTKILKIENDGFRLLINCREIGSQEVPHLHVHILGGNKLWLDFKPATK